MTVAAGGPQIRLVHEAVDAERVGAVYGTVFETDPAEFRDTIYPRHGGYEDFTLVLAEQAGELLGFAYGYTGRRGQWFSDRVAEELPEVAGVWIGAHFEFVELAVLEQARGRGLGRRLHDTLLGTTTSDRALLSTWNEDRPAMHLYRSAGWKLLSDRFLGERALMGRTL